jgi:WD40 repeat protein
VCDGLDNNCNGQIDEACQTCTSTSIDTLTPGHTATIQTVAIHPDGTQFATASADKSLKIWKRDGSLLHDISLPHPPGNHLYYTDKGTYLLLLFSDGNIRLYHTAKGTLFKTIPSSQLSTTELLMDAERKWFITGHADQSIRIWKTSDFTYTSVQIGAQANRFAQSNQSNTVGVFCSNNAFVSVNVENGKVESFDQVTGISLYLGFVFDASNKLLYAPSGRTIYTWDLVAKKRTTSINLGSSSYVNKMAVFGSDMTVAFSLSNRTILLYNIANKSTVATIRPTLSQNSRTSSIHYNAEAKAVLSGDNRGGISLFDTTSNKESLVISPQTLLPSNHIAYTADGTFIVNVRNRQEILVRKTNDLSIIHTIKTGAPVVVLRLSSDSKTLYAGLYDQESTWVRAYDVATGKELFSKKDEQGTILTIGLHPNGKSLLTTTEKNTIDIRSIADGSITKTVRGHTGPVNTILFLSESTMLTGSWDNTIKVWDTTSYSPSRTLQGHRSEVTTMALSPDTATLATGDKSGVITLWSTSDWTQIQTIPGRGAEITKLTFHPSKPYLLSSAKDGSIQAWDTSKNTAYLYLKGHQGGVFDLSFATSGTTFLSADAQGSRQWTCKW